MQVRARRTVRQEGTLLLERNPVAVARPVILVRLENGILGLGGCVGPVWIIYAMLSVFCRLENLNRPNLPCAVNGEASNAALLRPTSWESQAMLKYSLKHSDKTVAGAR